MSGRALTLSALATLAQARAIVTNHCPHDVFIWSIPHAASSNAENVPIAPSGRYEEPWRSGTDSNPGIAIKISTQPNGIYSGQDEIDFAYSIERSDSSKVWIDLSPVRGQAFDNNLGFFSCQGAYPLSIPDVPPHQCNATTEVELVLCGTERTTPQVAVASLPKMQECYDSQHGYTVPPSDSSNCTHHCGNESGGDGSASCMPGNDQPKCSSESHYSSPKPTSGQPQTSPEPTTTPQCQPSKLTTMPLPSVSEPNTMYSYPSSESTSIPWYYAPEILSMKMPDLSGMTTWYNLQPSETTTLQQHPSSVHSTVQLSYASKPTKIYVSPSSEPTQKEHYAPPEATTAQPHYSPPNPTSKGYMPPHVRTTNGGYSPPETTTIKYNAPSKPTTNAYSPPLKYTSTECYTPMPTTTGYSYPMDTETQYYAPPESTSVEGHRLPNYPDESYDYYVPDQTSDNYYSPS